MDSVNQSSTLETPAEALALAKEIRKLMHDHPDMYESRAEAVRQYDLAVRALRLACEGYFPFITEGDFESLRIIRDLADAYIKGESTWAGPEEDTEPIQVTVAQVQGLWGRLKLD